MKNSFIHCVISNKNLNEDNQVNIPMNSAPNSNSQSSGRELVEEYKSIMDEYREQQEVNRNSILGTSSSSEGNSVEFFKGEEVGDTYFFFLMLG